MKVVQKLALASVVALVLAGCGSGDDDDDSSSGGSGGDSAGSEQLAAISTMIEAGKEGLLYTEGPDEEATPETVTAKTGWQGPTSAPAPAKDKTIGILYCIGGTSCEDAGRAAGAAAEELGWKAVYVDGQATPQGYAEGFDTLLAQNVDAIITTAVPETVVADGIAKAHEQGVPVICVAEDPTGAADAYDAYVPFRETLASMMQAWYAINDTEGEAEVAYIWDVGYPHLQNALDAMKSVLDECEGCEIVAEDTAETVVFADPVKIGEKASAIAQRYPDLDYMLTAYDLGVPAIVQSMQSVGSEAKVTTKNARPSSLELLGNGLTMDSGTSADYAGWAAIDNTIRLFADEEPLEYWEQGLPLHIFDASNTDSPDYDWEAQVDFKTEYLKIWGVS